MEDILIPLAMWLLTVVGTKFLVVFLTRRQVYDHPNERSNHTIPTPRGGGLVTTLMILLGVVLYTKMGHASLLLGLALLAGISFLDDLKSMPIAARFGVQFAVVGLSLAYFPLPLAFVSWLPHGVAIIIAGFFLLWFINLTNFMDGIDGITGSETISIATGIAIIAVLYHLPPYLTSYSLILVAVAAGFLVWNWHPATLFMGDVGSIPLGFMLGWLLLYLAACGFIAAALILPGYYLADSTLTLIKRLLAGKKIWQAHSEHAYQVAVRNGRSHRYVVMVIGLVNTQLILLAVLSTTGSVAMWGSLCAAIISIAMLLAHLRCVCK